MATDQVALLRDNGRDGTAEDACCGRRTWRREGEFTFRLSQGGWWVGMDAGRARSGGQDSGAGLRAGVTISEVGAHGSRG